MAKAVTGLFSHRRKSKKEKIYFNCLPEHERGGKNQNIFTMIYICFEAQHQHTKYCPMFSVFISFHFRFVSYFFSFRLRFFLLNAQQRRASYDKIQCVDFVLLFFCSKNIKLNSLLLGDSYLCVNRFNFFFFLLSNRGNVDLLQ